VAYDKHDWLDPDHTSFALFSDERSEDFEQTAQELRLASSLDQTFSWMLGLYYQNAENDLTLDIFFPHAAGPPVRRVPPPPGAIAFSDGVAVTEETTWTSVFFSGTWNITDAVRLNIGGRYQDIEKDGVQTVSGLALFAGETSFYEGGRSRTFAAPVSVESNTDDILPEVSIQWDANQNIMLYARYAEAILAGGIVITPPLFQRVGTTYLPEFSEGYELGLKGRFANNTVEFNTAFYDVDFTDFQTSAFDRQSSTFITTNAGAAHTTGIEFDGRWAATDNFTLGFAGAFNEAEYDVFLTGCGNTLLIKQTAGACFIDLAGEQLPRSPEWEFVFIPQYAFFMGNYQASFSANMLFTDGVHLAQSFNGTGYDPLHVVDSSHRIDVRFAISPSSGSWEIALYGRDITDERVQTGGAFDLVQRSTDTTVYDGGGIQRARGARWGLQGSYFFGN
jgi:iron complex outermembrane receptor protein